MTVLAQVQVGMARPGEASRLSRALSPAFFHDPMMRWALPDDARRRRILPGAFELFATAILPYGETYVAGDTAGAALWVPPGRRAVPTEDIDGFTRRVEELTDYDAPRIFELESLLDDHRPRGSFHYLQFLGVQPRWQGRGIGSALLAPVLRACDRDRVAAYLVATSARNRQLYERHGFEVAGELAILGGPPLWQMWREPAERPEGEGS